MKFVFQFLKCFSLIFHYFSRFFWLWPGLIDFFHFQTYVRSIFFWTQGWSSIIFRVSKQHTSGFMFQKHFSRTDQKTAPVHVLPRDALREHIHRHIQKNLFQFHAKSWKSIWFFKSNLLKESARTGAHTPPYSKNFVSISCKILKILKIYMIF